MVTILEVLVIFTLIAYPISCIVFLRTLDPEKLPERWEAWINLFAYGYWSKANVEKHSNELWRPRFLSIRQKGIWFFAILLALAILTAFVG